MPTVLGTPPSGGPIYHTNPRTPTRTPTAAAPTAAPTGVQPSGGKFGGYNSLDDFIRGNWALGYGNKPVDIPSWQRYMADKPGDNYKPGDASTMDFDYWGKRLQGWQAEGDDAPTQGQYAVGGSGSPAPAPGTPAPTTSTTGAHGAQPPHNGNPNNAPVVGKAVVRGSEATNPYVAAKAAQSRIRQQAQRSGRSSTILGGFNTGQIRTTPTMLGGYR